VLDRSAIRLVLKDIKQTRRVHGETREVYERIIVHSGWVRLESNIIKRADRKYINLILYLYWTQRFTHLSHTIWYSALSMSKTDSQFSILLILQRVSVFRVSIFRVSIFRVSKCIPSK